MKWVSLLKDFKEKVGLSQSPSASSSSSSSPFKDVHDGSSNAQPSSQDYTPSSSRFGFLLKMCCFIHCAFDLFFKINLCIQNIIGLSTDFAVGEEEFGSQTVG